MKKQKDDKTSRMNRIEELFRTPHNEYRGMPFWAWNAKLNVDELKREIHAMKAAGLGGFFMHSRVGMGTAYLQDEFMECVGACIEEARALGMEAWLYDEDRWPSGSAGGMVTKEKKYRKKFCYWETLHSVQASSGIGSTIAYFAVKTLEKEHILNYRHLEMPEDCLAEETLVRFYVDTQAPSSWYNGETYIDPFSQEAVEHFIAVTHEAYKARFGAEFGKTVPGIFSDEPNWDVQHRLPWTDELDKKFFDAYGYNLLEHLPELAFYVGAETFSAARRDYRNLLAGLFAQSYAKTIGSWCEKNNLRWTGHVLYEDTLTLQTLAASPMRFYEYMSQPGMDLLTEHWNIFNTAIQCASAAHQLGRKRVLSETYGCTGWDFPLEGHKTLGDWQYALGINFRCQHLCWYTMEGEAKRDFPASIGPQSPWFPVYSAVEDYFARLGAVLADSQPLNALLVIHPIESMWGVFVFPQPPAGMEDITEIEVWRRAHIPDVVADLDNRFAALTNRLLEDKIQFDFGDEEMLSRLSGVESGVLKVGEAEYRAVLVPELYSIRQSTLNLLEKFSGQGGRVVFLGKAPQFLDGKPSMEPAKVFANFTRADEAQLIDAIMPPVAVTDKSGKNLQPVICRLGCMPDGAVTLFAVNTGMEFGSEFAAPRVVERNFEFPEVTIEVAIPKCGEVYELFAATGKIVRVRALYSQGKYHISSSFGKRESRLFVFTRETLAADETKAAVKAETRVPLTLAATASSEPNVLVLDHADCRIDGKSVAQDEYILSIDSLLRKILGTAPRGEAMVQPYLRKKEANPEQLHTVLDFAFEVGKVPETNCMLALEKPELFTIMLNDTPIPVTDQGYWVDPAIRKIKIPAGAFRVGKNELHLELDYFSALPGLEMVYLLGHFGVTGNSVHACPEKIALGDLAAQGMPYYAGNFDYVFKLFNHPEDSLLHIGNFGGCAVGVTFDSGAEQVLAWPPYETKVPDGAQSVRIRIYGHRRNAFGPFYSTGKWLDWSGPGQFLDQLTQERQLVPFGLYETPELIF